MKQYHEFVRKGKDINVRSKGAEMTDMDKCGSECEVYSHTFNRCSYEADIRADERAKIKEEFKIYHKLEAKFTLNQCKEKDGLYYIDVTELFYGLVDQVLGESK